MSPISFRTPTKDAIRVGYLFLFIGSFFCFIMGLTFLVDYAGIELFGENDPPYQWNFILAGCFSLVISAMSLISGLFFLRRRSFSLPLLTSIGMMIVGCLEYLLTRDVNWYLSPFILVSGIILFFSFLYLKTFYTHMATDLYGWFR